MIKILLQTDSDYVYTFLRIIAGIIVFPYGMQKLFGWFGAPGFGAPGIKGSLEQLTARNIPKFIAWLIIIGQSFGSIALMIGFLGRIAAGGLFIIFTRHPSEPFVSGSFESPGACLSTSALIPTKCPTVLRSPSPERRAPVGHL
jgi:hypothetical protein